MSQIIDFHAHIYPDSLEKLTTTVSMVAPQAEPVLTPVLSKLKDIRTIARSRFQPLASFMHGVQPWLREAPEKAVRALDFVGVFYALPSLLVESTPEDLEASMKQNNIGYTVVIAHPPVSSNEFVLEACAQNERLIAAVNIPPSVANADEKLREYVEQGAKILKIHPAADGEGVHSKHYAKLLKVADELNLPVILHTGCIHSKVIYKDPEQGHAERFSPWFEKYPNVKFILAHMNFHYPQKALELAEKFANVYVDTSWQPMEIIAKAVNRIGAERVLFGTDWPLLGHNSSVGLARVRECVELGRISQEEADLVLGQNAAKLLGLATL